VFVGGLMRVFDFDSAIVREPGRSVVDGIRSDPHCIPQFEEFQREHRAYVAALRTAGLEVDLLPPLDPYPDSVFVEDPALVFPEGAILLRPGAPTRAGEREEMKPALRKHFHRVLELQDDEQVDGGDVLVTPDLVFIGLSRRTSREGAEALRTKLEEFGRTVRIVQTPKDVLHFKTAVSLVSEDSFVMTRTMAESGIFDGFRNIVVPAGEEGAANSLRANDVVFVGECFPRTIDLIGKAGLRAVGLAVTEIGKLDAGLSCMSLRWQKAR
jgi:dimethylargininase